MRGDVVVPGAPLSGEWFGACPLAAIGGDAVPAEPWVTYVLMALAHVRRGAPLADVEPEPSAALFDAITTLEREAGALKERLWDDERRDGDARRKAGG